MITRRAALAAGAGALLAPAVARAEVVDDAELLRRAVRLEQLSAAGYTAAAAANVLDGDLARLAADLATHEQQHAAALATQLEALGGRKPRPPRGPAAADALARELELAPVTPALASAGAFLAWAQNLEVRAIDGYVEACRRALDVGLIQTLASILAAEGQQLAALREAAGQPAVHKPFLGGR